MPTVSVYIPTPMRRLTGGRAHVDVEVRPGETTLAQVVDLIEQLHPGLKAEIWEGADFKHYVNVYMNGEEVRALDGSATRVASGDQVAFVPMLAGGTDRLTIPRPIAEDMFEHANADFPNECCGLLAGHGSEVTRLHRMTNVEASPFMYLMDPKEQLQVFDAIDQAGDELLAIYHSHTHTQAYPSQTDIKQAYYPDSVYLIVSLAERANPVARAFRIVDGQVSELEVEIR
jgi:proteasome lid subunit RPN8/RPN11/molybdopterin converting factor small subunit